MAATALSFFEQGTIDDARPGETASIRDGHGYAPDETGRGHRARAHVVVRHGSDGMAEEPRAEPRASAIGFHEAP